LILLMLPAMAKAAPLLVDFSIKPRLCVLGSAGETCQDQLEIRWVASEPVSLCLHQVSAGQPLHCWEHKRRGHYSFELVTSASTQFQLRVKDSPQALGQQEFRVVYQDKQYRTPRRNPWSFY